MSCQDCGAHAHGDLCVDCRLDKAAQAVDVDDTTYECPEDDCANETSGRGVTCNKCRSNHVEVRA